MSLASQIAAGFTRVGNYIRDSVLPRLVPTGGTTGMYLRKEVTGFAWYDAPIKRFVVTDTDVVNATVTFAPVTGLSFAAVAGQYIVEFVGVIRSVATTNGVALALDIPAGTVSGIMHHPVSATALGGALQIADATTTGASTGVPTAGTDCPVHFRALISLTASGTVQLVMRSETAAANAVTLVAAKSVLAYTKVA